jgi:hypothetical protein
VKDGSTRALVLAATLLAALPLAAWTFAGESLAWRHGKLIYARYRWWGAQEVYAGELFYFGGRWTIEVNGVESPFIPPGGSPPSPRP